jgi:hypothetical protein
MATYRKRGSSWRAEVAKGGIRETKSFDTKAEAVAWATHLEAEIDAGRRRSYSKVQKTLSDAFDEYLKKISPGMGKHEWNKTRIEFFKGEMEFVGTLARNVKPEQIPVRAEVPQRAGALRPSHREHRKPWEPVRRRAVRPARSRSDRGAVHQGGKGGSLLPQGLR